MNKNKNTRRRERGIAVLFALGIMAIILVIVTLYSDVAISERRVANSYDSNQSAKLLAAALVDRIKMTISFAQRYSDTYDISTFVSRNAGPSTDPNINDCDFIYKLENGSDVSLEGYEYTNKGCPVWKYVKADDGQIIARYAYAGYLGSSEKLNPNDVAGKQIKTCTLKQGNSLYTVNLTATSHYGDDSLDEIGDPNYKYTYYASGYQIVTPANRAYNCRLGATLAELDVDPTAVSGGSITTSSLRSHAGNSWGDAASLLTGLGLTSSSDNIQKVEKDFSFSSKKYDEAYYAGDLNGNGARDREEYFHRFNFCVPQSKWNEWAEKAAANPEDDSNWVFLKEPISIATNANPEDGSYGIPFFINWTDSCGMASVKAARNQVMANILNAFADNSNNAYGGYPRDNNGIHTEYFPFRNGDTIPPISDVPASEWKTSSLRPTYTGNKRTMYLNELFVAVKLTGSYTPGSPSELGVYTGRTYTVKAQLYTGAEIVRMWPYDYNAYSMINPCAMMVYPYITGHFTANFSYGDREGISWHEGKSFCDVEKWCNWNEYPVPYSTATNGGKKYNNTHSGCNYAGAKYESVNNQQTYRIFYRGGIGEVNTADEIIFETTPEYVRKSVAEQKTGLLLIHNMKFHPDKFILTNYKAYFTDGHKPENNKNNGVPANYPYNSPVPDNLPVRDADHDQRGMNVDYAILPEVAISDIDLTPQRAGVNAIAWVCFTIQANDPRQNLNPNDWTIVKGNATYSEVRCNDKNGGNVSFDNNVFFKAAKNTTISKPSPCDPEANDNPAYGSTTNCQSSGNMPYRTTFSYDPSSFYPCTSVWQIGSIHRAKAWQTINLKKAMYYDRDTDIRTAPSGTYADGDALLLDQVKITPNTKMAKMNLYANDPDEAKKRYHSLFNNFRRMTNGQHGIWAPFQTGNTPSNPSLNSSAVSFPATSVDSPTSHTETIYEYLYTVISGRSSDNGSNKKFERRTDVLSDDKFCEAIKGNGTNDAQQEEAIGRLLNLTEYMPPTDPSVSIVVQTINDVGGTFMYPGGDETWDYKGGTANSSTTIGKAKWNEKMAGYVRPNEKNAFGIVPNFYTTYPPGRVFNAQVGRYDLYADKITGEAKINVVVHYDITTNQWKIRSYEYTE